MDSGFFRVLSHLACPTGLPITEVTFADLAKSAGYKTALIGKCWGTTATLSLRELYHIEKRGGSIIEW